MKTSNFLLIFLLIVLGGGCTAKKSETGTALLGNSNVPPETSMSEFLTLPAGDVERGAKLFEELQCFACHRVKGGNLPEPYATPPAPMVLGEDGPIPSKLKIANSIINPAHEIAPGHKDDLVRSGILSRMGDYTDLITVRQLADLVQFVQSRYSRAM